MMKRLSLLSAVVLCSALTGCSWLTIGEETFSCSGMPGDPKCMSASDMYYYSLNHPPESEGGSVVSGSGTQIVSGNGATLTTSASASASSDSATKQVMVPAQGEEVIEVQGRVILGDDEITQNFVTPRLPYAPVPVRTPAMVMRIWVASYEDVNGDLIAPGYVYTEIEPRRWVTERGNVNKPSHFTPLVKTVNAGTSGNASDPKTLRGPGRNSLEILKENQRAKQK